MRSKTINDVEGRTWGRHYQCRNREVKAVKPEKWISVESQPKQMPITTMENITLTDKGEI